MLSSSKSDGLPPAVLGFQDPAPDFCLTLWTSSQGQVSDRSLFSSVCIVPTHRAVVCELGLRMKTSVGGEKKEAEFPL